MPSKAVSVRSAFSRKVCHANNFDLTGAPLTHTLPIPMKTTPLIAQRLIELEAQHNAIQIIKADRAFSYAEESSWRQWATSALNIIGAASGKDSAHYNNFKTLYEKANGWESDLESMKGVFLAAKADFEGGYLFQLEATISGEIFGDFVSLAKHTLKDGNKDVAAVLACAALEDALKRFATTKGLDVNGKVMQDIVGALKSKGLVSGAQKSLLDTMPKIRDYAMHANWDKLSAEDVSGVIGFVEQFLLSHF